MNLLKKAWEEFKKYKISRPQMRDWDSIYEVGKTPWDSGKPCPELKKTLSEFAPPKNKRALELGCGTGTNSIYLSEYGFKVTGVDYSKYALLMARKKARDRGVKIKFIQANLPQLPENIGQFDFIFDRGCFHSMAYSLRGDYAEMVKNILNDTGLFLLMTGNAREHNPSGGPPVLTEKEIKDVFKNRLSILRIRDARFTTEENPDIGPLAHSVLMAIK